MAEREWSGVPERVEYYVEFQTRKNMDDGTWSIWKSPFSGSARAAEMAEYYREAYVNVRIRTVRTSESVESYE